MWRINSLILSCLLDTHCLFRFIIPSICISSKRGDLQLNTGYFYSNWPTIPPILALLLLNPLTLLITNSLCLSYPTAFNYSRLSTRCGDTRNCTGTIPSSLFASISFFCYYCKATAFCLSIWLRPTFSIILLDSFLNRFNSYICSRRSSSSARCSILS